MDTGHRPANRPPKWGGDRRGGGSGPRKRTTFLKQSSLPSLACVFHAVCRPTSRRRASSFVPLYCSERVDAAAQVKQYSSGSPYIFHFRCRDGITNHDPRARKPQEQRCRKTCQEEMNTMQCNLHMQTIFLLSFAASSNGLLLLPE